MYSIDWLSLLFVQYARLRTREREFTNPIHHLLEDIKAISENDRKRLTKEVFGDIITSTQALSKIFLNRLQKELLEWQMNPPFGWIIEVYGASGTLYSNETYQLQVDFPEHYPMEAPKVFGSLDYFTLCLGPLSMEFKLKPFISFTVIFNPFSPTQEIRFIELLITSNPLKTGSMVTISLSLTNTYTYFHLYSALIYLFMSFDMDLPWNGLMGVVGFTDPNEKLEISYLFDGFGATAEENGVSITFALSNSEVE
ncbi:hypothetical protein GIB67_004856 [Kingdonia uniflora]|uniref:UBC core domain-containing protein n=1 Tax=Kingdonia uniflora TaxID=39325 RepID=A0A7J7LNH8_9MAGN|nr:hypothetical protein GIB67_004856 [Kingdonia uniflora]